MWNIFCLYNLQLKSSNVTKEVQPVAYRHDKIIRNHLLTPSPENTLTGRHPDGIYITLASQSEAIPGVFAILEESFQRYNSGSKPYHRTNHYWIMMTNMHHPLGTFSPGCHRSHKVILVDSNITGFRNRRLIFPHIPRW